MIGTCVYCDETIEDHDAWSPLNAVQYGHYECGLREVMGGIGHHLGHEYWCVVQRDTDAGLTRRQSAKLVVALIDMLGIDEVVRRSVVP
jgi:hypothetical protein